MEKVSLSEAIAAEKGRDRHGPQCGVETITAGFDAADLARFETLLAEVKSGARTASSASRILKRAGITYYAGGLLKHTRGECSCDQ